MVNLSIPCPCSSIQSHNVASKLVEWRRYIYEKALEQNLVANNFIKPEDGMRDLIKNHANGPCKMQMTFYFKKSKLENVPDIDNLASFITACFKTEATGESRRAKKDMAKAGFTPWFYFTLFWFPHSMDIVSGAYKKILAADADMTNLSFELIANYE